MPYDESKKQIVGSAAIADLTGAFGAADGAMEDVGAAFNQGALNNNFRELQTKVNQILAAMRTSGQISSS